MKISGYSRSAFYSNYEDKYDWARKIYENEMDYYVTYSREYSDAINQGLSPETCIDVICRYLQYVYENRDVYELLCLKKIPLPPVDETCHRLKKLVNREHQFIIEKENPNFDQDFYEYLKLCDSFEHIEYWRLNGFRFSPREMAGKIYAILLHRECGK